MDEFAFISSLLRPLAAPEALGLRDDAALLQVPHGKTLVITKDAISAGVHFLGDEPAALIARKLLRTNLSDLAAMGAEPYGYFLALMLPRPTSEDWLKDFTDGLKRDQQAYGLPLMGGDTISTLGPLALSATLLGLVPDGRALTRSGARPGDAVYVSGMLGDGALGLRVAKHDPALATLGESHRSYLLARYRLPEPRLALGIALRAIATACMDISDGFAQDIGHLGAASGVGAVIEAAAIPLSPAAREAIALLPQAAQLPLTGGDDYELLFTVPMAQEHVLDAIAIQSGVSLTRIGRIKQAEGIEIQDGNGAILELAHKGYRHGL